VLSITASATNNELNKNSINSITTVKISTKKEAPIQATDNSKDQAVTSISHDIDKSEPLLPTGWLLTMALFGFVILSNRNGV
jgi:hypothetical protein